MPRSFQIAAIALICVPGSSLPTWAVDLHFAALSADQLSLTVSGRAPEVAPLHYMSVDRPDAFTAKAGIVIKNDVTDASSLGQAAASVAVHATLRLPQAF